MLRGARRPQNCTIHERHLAQPHVQEKEASRHVNVMLGSTSRTHTVTHQLRAKGATRTTHDISQLGVYCEDNVGPLDVISGHC